MTKQEELYIETHNAWVKSVELNQKELEISINHNKGMAEVFKYKVIAYQSHFDLNERYLKAGQDQFNEWIKENNIKI